MLDCRQVSLLFHYLRNKQSTLAQYMVACFVDMCDNSAMQYPAEPHGCDSECNSQRMRALSLCDSVPRAHFTTDGGVKGQGHIQCCYSSNFTPCQNRTAIHLCEQFK